MNLTVLGASGGLGGLTGSTCVQINNQLILDAGTGLMQLPLKSLQRIRNIVLTHSHSDHICCLPQLLAMLAATTSAQDPVTIYAHPDTILTLRQHVFNWQIWPDFEQTQSNDAPVIRWYELQPDAPLTIAGVTLTPFLTHHSVTTLGFAIEKGQQTTLWVSDTGYSAALVKRLNEFDRADHLVLECSFPNELASVARKSYHLTPALCLQLVNELTQPPQAIWINHLKPDLADMIHQQLRKAAPTQGWQVLL